MDGFTIDFFKNVVLPFAGVLFAGGGIGTLIGYWIQARKVPSEIRAAEVASEKTEAEVTEKYLAIADRAAERALKLDDRVLLLEGRVADQQSTINDQQKTIEELKCENVSLRSDHEKLAEDFDRVLAGAHVLHDQVKELKGIPKFKPPERRIKKPSISAAARAAQ